MLKFGGQVLIIRPPAPLFDRSSDGFAAARRVRAWAGGVDGQRHGAQQQTPSNSLTAGDFVDDVA